MARFSRGSLQCKRPIIVFDTGVNTTLTRLFSQEKVMEMECDLLISNFKNAKTIDLVNENIGRISGGSSSHSASALKLGLKKAFDLKKQPPVTGVNLLRCSNSYCTWYRNPRSYSSVNTSNGLTCNNCNYHLQCAGCGYNRTGQYRTCQSCGIMWT